MTMLRIAEKEEFDEIFSILEASFPSDEYRSYQDQKDLLAHPDYSIYVLPDPQNNKIKAFITAWQFDGFTFLEHFAVSSHYRNQGLGSLILQEILSILPHPICLEVELPETDFARRRIGFYERNGFTLNDYPYTQPAYGSNKNPIPLLIMTTGGTIPAEQFEQMKHIIWAEVYHVLY